MKSYLKPLLLEDPLVPPGTNPLDPDDPGGGGGTFVGGATGINDEENPNPDGR